jgi:hypothetical protein
MPYQIVRAPTPQTREIIATLPTYADAERAARAMFNIAFFDRDTDVTYDAADFIATDGTIYSIDPSKGA